MTVSEMTRDDPVAMAEDNRWTALVRLAEAVQSYKALPADAPRDALDGWLEGVEAEYVAAHARHQEALANT